MVTAIPAGGFPGDVAAGEGAIWVFLPNRYQLTRISPAFDEVGRIKLPLTQPLSPCGFTQASVAIARGSAWILCITADVDSRLLKVNLRTGAVVDLAFETGQAFVPVVLWDLGYGLGSAWVINREANTVTPISTATNESVPAKAVTVGSAPAALAFGDDSIWVANEEGDSVTRIAIGSDRVPALTTIPVGDGPVDVAFGEAAVWVANGLDRTVSRIDPETNDVVATIEVGNVPRRIAAGEGAVWVTVAEPVEGEQG